MDFKYFDKPNIFVGLLETETKCHFCKQTKMCFDASSFHGSTGFLGFNKVKSICPECLFSGKLKKTDLSTCTGDATELRRQLKELNPDLNEEKIDSLVELKTGELEKTTPHLVTWQDWNWPCADGDYCRFIGYGSKPLFRSLAAGQSEIDLFKASLYKGYDYGGEEDRLWKEYVPDEEVKNYSDSSQLATLFYVFRSLNSKRLVTVWDSE